MAKIPGHLRQAMRMRGPIVKKERKAIAEAAVADGLGKPMAKVIPLKTPAVSYTGKGKRRGSASLWARGMVGRVMKLIRGKTASI